MNLWDPERISSIGRVMEACAPHMYDGVLVRDQIEGDPCNKYASNPTDAPSGTAKNVQHRADGFVTFDVDLSDGRFVSYDNRNISNVWEVHPDFLSTFRGAIDKTSSIDVETAPPSTKDEHYRGLQLGIEELREELGKVSDINADFRSSIMESLQKLSHDCINIRDNRPTEFIDEFLRAAAGTRHDVPPDDYRGDRHGEYSKSLEDESTAATDRHEQYSSDAHSQVSSRHDDYRGGQKKVTPLHYGELEPSDIKD